MREELGGKISSAAHVLSDGLQEATNALDHTVHDVANALNDTMTGLAQAEARVQGQVHAALSEAMHLPSNSPVQMWPLGVFMLSAFLCLGTSAVYHTFHVMDAQWFALLSSLDYTGIAVLIFGSTLPMLSLGFHCRPLLGNIYIAVGTLIALGTVYVGVSPAFRTSDYRKVRMASFIATGCYGALPFAHLAATGEPIYPEALLRLVIMGGFYICGALLYGFRVPERYFPGRFDTVLQSHNIFHVCVFVACVIHYRALWAHYAWRQAHSACPATAPLAG